MVKTQIQVPDQLYREAKRIAREREISFAEVVRRGLEAIVRTYPCLPQEGKYWRPPAPRDLGWKGLDHARVKAAALEDQELKGRV
ncbi:MAG: antitoxin [Acidobacteriota bacterium]